MPVENFQESTNKNPYETQELRLQEKISKSATLSIWQRIKKINSDPECQRAMNAVGRTLINAGISVADLFPGGIGEAFEIGALTAKISNPTLRHIAGFFGKRAVETVKNLDTLPNVTRGQAIVTSIALTPVELATFGTASTFFVSAVRQLIYDYKNGNFDGVSRLIKILITGEDLPISDKDKKLLDVASEEF